MSQDRRRQTRIQNCKWAPSNQNLKPALRHKNEDTVKDQDLESVKIRPGYPAWTAKNVDCPQHSKGFVYQKPSEDELRRRPADRIIDEAGVYDLSKSENGLSRIRYYPQFLTGEQADEAFASLMNELQWKQKTNKKYGVNHVEPRMTAWFGDVDYHYSGVVQEANPNWTPTLKAIKEKLEELTGVSYNSMLANLYRDGKDSIDWHSDSEPSLGKNPVIASVSLGEARSFELRQNPHSDEPSTLEGTRDYAYSQHVRILLTHGSLLLMEGCTQHDWQHRVPKEYHDKEARINLTFRVIRST